MPAELLQRPAECASQNARLAPYGTTIASWSTTTMKLGIVSATVFAKSRWRWRSSSRRLRSVMSIPPAMIRTTLPLSSTSGAERQAITRSFPFASVNTFSYSDASKAGRGCVEALDHRLALVRIDEDVPEVRALEPTAVVEPARDLDRAVEVPHAALRVDDRQQARRSVDDRLEEAVLSTHLGLEALLLERQRRGRGDGVDEGSLVREAPIVEERRDALAAVLDERRGVRALRQRLGERPAVLVDPALAFVRPVGEVERRIAEGLCERVAKRCPVADRDREVGDPRSCEPRPEDAHEERDGHQRERADGDELDDEAGGRVDRAHDAAREEVDQRDQRDEVDRPEHATQRRRCLAVAPYESQPERPPGLRRPTSASVIEMARARPGQVGDEERALGAVLARRERARVEERDRQRAERHQRQHGPDERPILPSQLPGRVREDQVREGHERERRSRRSRAVNGSDPSAACRAPSDQRSPTASICAPVRFVGRRAAAIAPVTVKTSPATRTSANRLSVSGSRGSLGDDEEERARVQDGTERDGGREPVAGHLSSERTAVPDSSAFAMKPRARLLRISPS